MRIPQSHSRLIPWLYLGTIMGLWLAAQFKPPQTASASNGDLAGRIVDEQGEPVRHAEVLLFVNSDEHHSAHDTSQADGSYLLAVPEDVRTIHSVRMEIERPHFQTAVWELSEEELTNLLERGGLVLHDIVLARRFGVGFWATTLIFIGMLVLITLERVHNTLAALIAMAAIFTVSSVGGALNTDLFIFDFERALEFVDFEVIFLLLGMMIVIGIIEETGIFQWLAYQAYQLSRGRSWLLTAFLILITAVTSALLDNVITMLLIAPISLEIALAMGIDPLALLIPEVLSSNIGGVATLVGTPTNILIGSYAGLTFNDFLVNLTPGVLAAEVGLIIFSLLWYRKEHRKRGARLSSALQARLAENARIKDPMKLRRSGIVFGVLLLLFVFGESIRLTPAVSAIIGAVIMLVWVNPNIDQMMSVVDWTTLMFFIGLFMVVGAVQEVGLVALASGVISRAVGDSAILAMLMVVIVTTVGSGLVENIPFTAAMLPVVRYLAQTVPGAGGPALYYALSIGAGMGGNSSLIGSSPNLVTAGIALRAGYRITFRKFLAVGLPVTLITVTIGYVWLLIRF